MENNLYQLVQVVGICFYNFFTLPGGRVQNSTMDYHYGTFPWDPKLAKIHTRPYEVLLGGLLGVAVVPDQSIVNSELTSRGPEPPITSGEEAHTPRGSSCINMTSRHSAEKERTTYGRRYSWTHPERQGPLSAPSPR